MQNALNNWHLWAEGIACLVPALVLLVEFKLLSSRTLLSLGAAQ
jgi:hypothetical protein